jgi:hypothetical protein
MGWYDHVMSEPEFWFLHGCVKWARESGMFAEFWTHYKLYRNGGESVVRSCHYALWDWDL